MAHSYAKGQPASFSNRIERIAFIGATGQLGGHILPELLKSGKHTVTVLTRRGSASSSSSSLPTNLHVADVDYADEESLVAVLTGQDFLIITLSVSAPPDTHSIIVRAAAKAGVPWVLPNTYGFDFLNDSMAQEAIIGTTLRAHCREIEALGVSSWVSVVCGLWYEYSLILGPVAFGFDLPAKKLTLFDDGNVKMNVSTWSQIGRTVAALVGLKILPEDEGDSSRTLSQFRNKPVYTSSFLVSQRDMFESWKRVTGETDGEWTVDGEPIKERWTRGRELLAKGDRSGGPQMMFSRQWFAGGGGDFESTRGLANELLGLPAEDLDESTRAAKKLYEGGYADWVHKRFVGGGGNSVVNRRVGKATT